MVDIGTIISLCFLSLHMVRTAFSLAEVHGMMKSFFILKLTWGRQRWPLMELVKRAKGLQTKVKGTYMSK